MTFRLVDRGVGDKLAAGEGLARGKSATLTGLPGGGESSSSRDSVAILGLRYHALPHAATHWTLSLGDNSAGWWESARCRSQPAGVGGCPKPRALGKS